MVAGVAGKLVGNFENHRTFSRSSLKSVGFRAGKLGRLDRGRRGEAFGTGITQNGHWMKEKSKFKVKREEMKEKIGEEEKTRFLL